MAEPRNQHQSPDYGGKFGYGFFHLLLRLCGVTPAYVFLALIIPYYVLLRPSARRSASYYLRHRFPSHGPLRRLLDLFIHFYRFGQVLIDQGAIGILGQERFQVDFPAEQELYELARRQHEAGRGLVLLTSHLGNWRPAMAKIGNLGVTVNFQFQLEPHMAGRHFFDLTGQQNKFKIVPPSGFLGGVVEFTNALKAGECVSMMGDRAFGAKTRKQRFLGAEAFFPILPYQLALCTESPVVALLTARTGKLRCHMEYVCLSEGLDLAALPRQEAIDQLLARYVACLERYLEKYPFMWFNFFDIWNVDR